MRGSLEVRGTPGGGGHQGMVEFRGQPLGLSTLETTLLSFTWRISKTRWFFFCFCFLNLFQVDILCKTVGSLKGIKDELKRKNGQTCEA